MAMAHAHNNCEVKPIEYFEFDHLIINGWKGEWTLSSVKHDLDSRSLLLLEINLLERKSVVHVKDSLSESVKDIVIVDSDILVGGWGNLEITKCSIINGEEVRILVKDREDRSMSFNIFMYGIKPIPASKLYGMLNSLIEMSKEEDTKPCSTILDSCRISCSNDQQVQALGQRRPTPPAKGIRIAKAIIQRTDGSPPEVFQRPGVQWSLLNVSFSNQPSSSTVLTPFEVELVSFDQLHNPTTRWILKSNHRLKNIQIRTINTQPKDVYLEVYDKITNTKQLTVMLEPLLGKFESLQLILTEFY